MKFLLGFLLCLCLLLAGAAWGAQHKAQPAARPASATSACEDAWRAIAQQHRAQAEAIQKQTSTLRALLTMLRSDAGIARESTVRDALQVDADMWESALVGLQAQAASLQTLAQQEETQRSALCRK
ncbi:MAG TPA: hypothetical protein VKT29_04885 [Terriglobales bacterium]|nr:hypothetical protein [Terriglobales bacterium]